LHHLSNDALQLDRDSATLKLSFLGHLVANILFGGGDLSLLAFKLLFPGSHRCVALR
jgi:hypothetical protein